jgi:hypothetical protein
MAGFTCHIAKRVVMAGLPEQSVGKPGHPFPHCKQVFMGPRDTPTLHFGAPEDDGLNLFRI